MTAKGNLRSEAGLAPVVLKIGGSVLQRPDALKPILGVLSKAERPVAVVTGGGIFADAVRDAQKKIGFDDTSAHRMAILAMHQNTLLLKSLLNGFEALAAVSDVQSALGAQRGVVWLPLVECMKDPDLPATWDATSDAIAVRLAERLGGLEVCFLKSRQPKGALEPQDLADEGLIDPVAARFLTRSKLPFRVIEASDIVGLANCLAVGENVDAPGAT